MMTSLAQHFVALAGNNLWANHRLHAVCGRLTEAELGADRVSFFGSILRTLNHILVVDWYYLDALEGGGHGPALYSDPEPFPRLGDLRSAQRDADRRLLAYSELLDDVALARPVVLVREGGVRHDELVPDVLAHLFQHQVHHRGQVHGMLSGTSVAPPQLDEYFLAEDAARRAEEMRALGLPPR